MSDGMVTIMRAAILLFVLVAATPASAYCPSFPDDGSTGYVRNNTARALCLQRELAIETDFAAEQARIDAELRNLQIELRQQQLVFMQPQLPVWPSP